MFKICGWLWSKVGIAIASVGILHSAFAKYLDERPQIFLPQFCEAWLWGTFEHVRFLGLEEKSLWLLVSLCFIYLIKNLWFVYNINVLATSTDVGITHILAFSLFLGIQSMCFTNVPHEPKCTANIVLEVDFCLFPEHKFSTWQLPHAHARLENHSEQLTWVPSPEGPRCLGSDKKRNCPVGYRQAKCMEQDIGASGCFWCKIACSRTFAGQMEYVGITQDTGWCMWFEIAVCDCTGAGTK